MNKIIYLVVCLFVTSLSYGELVSCPENVVFNTSLDRTINGYSVFPKKVNINVTRASVYSGHPQEMFMLKPDPNILSNSKNSLWLRCYYFDRNSQSEFSIIRELSKSFKDCTPHVKKNDGRFTKLDCR